MLAFSDGCCPKMDLYEYGEKQQGSFIIQADKVNGNCHYVQEGGRWKNGLWMCGDSWWEGELYDIGQCKGYYQASIDSNSNVHVQDDSLQWKSVRYGSYGDLKFDCIDLCL